MESMEEKLRTYSNCRPYFYSACMICMETGSIKYCIKCKVAVYCSKEHQTIDWKHHKVFCNDLCSLNIEALHNVKPETFFNMCNGKIKLIETLSNKKLKGYERSMCLYPKVCITCYTDKNLTTCSTCNCASFCTEHHKSDYEKHTKYCPVLKFCFDIEKYFWVNGIYGSDIKVKPIPENQLLEEAPKFIEFTNEVPSELEQKLKEYVLSGTLSIINAFDKLGLIKNQQFIKKKMILHLIIPYSDLPYLLNFKKCREFYFHWLSNLKYLKLYYFGFVAPGDNIKSDVTSGLCENCVKNKRVQLEMHDKDYHLKEGLLTPDLIFFFEVNFTEGDWKEAIPIMLKFRKPICFTSSTSSKMDDNIKYLESFGIKSEDYVLKNELNQFHNKQPFRNPLLDPEISPVIYKEERISIVLKSSV